MLDHPMSEPRMHIVPSKRPPAWMSAAPVPGADDGAVIAAAGLERVLDKLDALGTGNVRGVGRRS